MRLKFKLILKDTILEEERKERQNSAFWRVNSTSKEDLKSITYALLAVGWIFRLQSHAVSLFEITMVHHHLSSSPLSVKQSNASS